MTCLDSSSNLLPPEDDSGSRAASQAQIIVAIAHYQALYMTLDYTLLGKALYINNTSLTQMFPIYL